MSWEISISSEGWQEIRDELDNWSVEDLSNAIADDEMEKNENMTDKEFDMRVLELEKLPQDVLADHAFSLIQENNVCDNGGYGYWIDKEGYHRVILKD